MGLRERKKEQTRQRIAETAHRLFGEHGFHRVTVAEVARAAEVAEATLFNYFPTKEDLFYSGLEVFGARLVDAVRQRPAGRSVAAAFRTVLLGGGGQLDRIAEGDRDALEDARTTARVVAGSPALQARERQTLHAVAASLAAAISETGDAPVGDAHAAVGSPDPLAHAVANALMGVHLALLDYARRRLLADDRPETIAADVRHYGDLAMTRLERGIGG